MIEQLNFGLETPADCGIRRVEEQVSALRRRTLSQGGSQSQEFFEALGLEIPIRAGGKLHGLVEGKNYKRE